MQAVLFDMDGTLIDSRRYWFAVIQDASAHFGGRDVAWSEFIETFGQSALDDARQFFPAAPVEKVDAFYNAALPKHGHHIVTMEGALDVVTELKTRDIAVGCVTNSPRVFTMEVLARVGLLPHLRTIVTADDVTHAKPAPDMLLLGAKQMGVTTENCLMVGDSKFDAMAARAARMRFIGLHVDGDARIERLSQVGQYLQ